jgi:cytochrome c553
MGFGGRLAVVAAIMATCSNVLAGDAVQDLIRKAASDSPTHAALVKEGRSASFFCAKCHGDSGTSRYPEVPNLAGQNPVYIANQISAFVNGKRRNEFMQGLMKVLSDREKAAIAVYFADAASTPSGKGGRPRPRASHTSSASACAAIRPTRTATKASRALRASSRSTCA